MSSPDEFETQARWFQEHLSRHVPFNVEIGLDIVKREPGNVQARLAYAHKLSAHDGIFHGGVLSAAIDTNASGAVVAGHDFSLGNRFTTVAMNVQFMAVAKEPEVIIEGTCLRRGRRLNFARGRVLSLDGDLLAEGTLTVNASGQRPRVGIDEGPGNSTV